MKPLKPEDNSGVNILIVEDSPTQADELRHLLEEHGYSVVVASNGREALAAMQKEKPAILISDILMPEMDGYALCEKVKTDEKLKDIPVILVTTLSNAQDIVRGLQSGADNFIRKPYDEKYLLSRIHYILVNRELRQSQKMHMGVEIYLGGQKHVITCERQQIVDLLISVYEEAIHINEELKVRQKELSRSNQALEHSTKELQMTQDQLIQSEKLAALGRLMASVAHEINTPVGVGMTASSHLEIKVLDFTRQYQSGTIARQDMEKFLSTAKESSKLIQANLKRAVEQIQSFKQVAVDQSSGERRSFKLVEYLNEVLHNLTPLFKKTSHIIRLDCSEDMEIFSYPGVFSQIFTNLLMNSLHHGFDAIDQGEIIITIRINKENVILWYSDNGKGIDPKHLDKIFDPFFTTKRGKGGSGIGLNIVYNLVTQVLRGTINCQSELGKGVLFEISLPIQETHSLPEQSGLSI